MSFLPTADFFLLTIALVPRRLFELKSYSDAVHNLLYALPVCVLLDVNTESDPWWVVNREVGNCEAGNVSAPSGAGRRGPGSG